MIDHPSVARSLLVAIFLLLAAQTVDAQITEIINSSGDGLGNTLKWPLDVATDASGNVFVTGNYTDNAFKITPFGAIIEIINSSGDGLGNLLDGARAIAADTSGNVFVVSVSTDIVFKITPGGVITKIIDKAGSGLDFPTDVATDLSGNVFVTGLAGDNAYKITPGGVITEIIDSSGAGAPDTLDVPTHIATDASGNVFVSDAAGRAFKIATPGSCKTSGPLCTIREIINIAGDGAGRLFDIGRGIATDASGNVFVASSSNAPLNGQLWNNVFKIFQPPVSIGHSTEIIDFTGDGAGNPLKSPEGLSTDASGNVFVTSFDTHGAFKITPGGIVTQVIDTTGDGAGNWLFGPFGTATDASGNLFVTGLVSDNLFKITPGGVITEIIDATGDGAGNILDGPFEVATDASGNVFVAGFNTHNAFKISTPGSCSTVGTPCTITALINAAGDGSKNWLTRPSAIVSNAAGNLFVSGENSNNIFAIALTPPITANLKIFLEGPYQSGTDDMSVAINSILPLSQPYDSTLFNGTQLDYDGLESVMTMPSDIVDWVLVQLRTGNPAGPPMTIVASRAALLKSDGTIVDTDGTSAVRFPGQSDGNYYLVVFHRNHLGIITSSTVAL